jgi:predicted helicase
VRRTAESKGLLALAGGEAAVFHHHSPAEDPKAAAADLILFTRGASGGRGENRVICCAWQARLPPVVQVAACDAGEAPDGRAGLCFPFYAYDADGTHRRENITDWVVEQFQQHYGEPVISKWSIFDYVYGVLHHPGYRATFAGQPHGELPRIPLASDFRAFQEAGQKLIELHLNYHSLEPWPLQRVEKPGVPVNRRAEKMKLTKDKSAIVVNESLTLSDIPPQAFEHRLGSRSALEWVIDRYRVGTDKRSESPPDPNLPDGLKDIVRLVGQVVRASAETVKIVQSLPPR